MKKKEVVPITGGAGYIGSHANKLLTSRGYETVVVDNLVYGHKEHVKRGDSACWRYRSDSFLKGSAMPTL